MSKIASSGAAPPRKAGLTSSQESPAATMSGYPMLLLLAVGVAAIIYGIAFLPEAASSGLALIVGAGILMIFILSGFYLLSPNQAAAIQLFGTYKGSDRNTGLRWVLPWLTRRKISVRIHNVTSDTIKVNDLRGNPIEVATNVVWRVTDTARALFDVEDYQEFVDIQIESAVRVIASRYPYDDIEHDEVTLRGDADEVSEQLEIQLLDRVERAGVIIDECRLTHLAYAPEIAQAMLRRQQAQAVIAARRQLVQGAVGMVEMALAQLSEKNVVELDAERRAAMVSNLMVVLCSERDTQPIVNAGSLYQ